MVQAIVTLNETENRILNIIKGKFGLRNKSDAVNFIIKKYGENLLEPELKPEFIEEMTKIEKEKPVKIKNFRKHFGLD